MHTGAVSFKEVVEGFIVIKRANKEKIRKLLQEAIRNLKPMAWNQIIEINEALEEDNLSVNELEELVEELADFLGKEWGVYDGDEGILLMHFDNKQAADKLAKSILDTHKDKWNGVYFDAEVYSKKGDFNQKEWWVEARVQSDFY